MNEKKAKLLRKAARGEEQAPPKERRAPSASVLCKSGLRLHSWKWFKAGAFGNKRREKICKNCGKEARLASWRTWLTAALAAILLAACAEALPDDSRFLVRVDSDRTEWTLTLGKDTLQGGSPSYPHFFCEFPEGALSDSVKLWKRNPRGFCRLMVYDEKGRVVYGDTLETLKDTARVFVP